MHQAHGLAMHIADAFGLGLSLGLLAFLLAGLAFAGQAQSMSGMSLLETAESLGKPNVLLIVVDDLNDYAFVDGHPESAVPNIARLTDRGTRFNNAYCSSPLCAPSRISFMSGKDVDYTGITRNIKVDSFRQLFTSAGGNETVFTIPEVLKDSGGYYTIGVNKLFHNFFRPGYDNDFDSTSLDPCGRAKSWNDFDIRPDSDGITVEQDGFPSYSWGKVPNGQEDLLTDYRAVDRVLRFMQDYRANPSDFCNRPFFAAVGLVRPHTPQYVPERYFPNDYIDDYYAVPFDIPYNEPFNAFPPNGFFMPPFPTPQYADYEALGPTGQALAREYLNRHALFESFIDSLPSVPVVDPLLTDSARREILRNSKRANAAIAYWASVRYIDAQIGRIVDFLDANPDLRDSTIIVLTSDHGYALGEKSHWQKQALWETDIRVPFLVVDPRREGGRVSRRTVSLLDLFPTLLDLTGTPEPSFPDGSRYLDGQSIVPLLDNPDAPWERPVLSTVSVPSSGVSTGGCFDHYSVRSERWHYIRYQTDAVDCIPGTGGMEEELYEIGPEREEDAFEWENLAGDPAYNPVKEYLAQWLPGGRNYHKRAPRIRIRTDALPCRLTNSDTLRLDVDLWDENGVPISGTPAGTKITYRVLPFGRVLNGREQSVSMKRLDSIQFANLEELEFIAVLYSLADGIVAQDTRHVPLQGGRLPTSSFVVQQQDNFIQIDSLVVDGDPLRTWWTFGDGVRSDDYWAPGYDDYYESAAPQHLYTETGDFDVIHHLSYGTPPGETCIVTESLTVSITDSMFLNQPCQTPGVVRLEAQAQDGTTMARWSPVYQDETFELRYRLSSPPDAPWTVRPSNVPTLLLDSLIPTQEYTFSVRAICDTAFTSTDTSDWSYPFRQRVLRCDPPTGLSADSIAPDATLLTWDPQSGVVGYEVAWRELGTPFINTLVDAPVHELLLTGLGPGIEYGAGIRSLCTQIFTEEPIPGVFTYPITWFTSLPVPRLESAVQEAGQGEGDASEVFSPVQVQPNPASGTCQLHNLPEQGFWKLIDARGQVRSSGLAQQSSPSLDLTGLAPGTYWVLVQHQGKAQVTPLVVAP
jgi:arylsulfatase A-like enzyme